MPLSSLNYRSHQKNALLVVFLGIASTKLQATPNQLVENLPFTAVPGHAYHVEWKQTNGAWLTEPTVHFATSNTLYVRCPANAPKGTGDVRLAPANGAAGFAPLGLVGNQIRSVNSTGKSTTLSFMNASRGVLSRGASRLGFIYSYVKSGLNQGQLILTVGTAQERWELTFSRSSTGEVSISKTFPGNLIDQTITGFVYGPPQAVPFGGSSSLPEFPAGTSPLPASPANKKFAMVEHSRVFIFLFSDDSTLLTLDAMGNPLGAAEPYVWDIETATHAQLTVGSGTSARQYGFDVQGDGTATFIRAGGTTQGPAKSGGAVLPPVEPPAIIPGGNGNGGNGGDPCAVPESLTGRRLKLEKNVGSGTYELLTFGTTTGQGSKQDEQNAEAQNDQFDYQYQRVDENSGKLTTSTPGVSNGQVDEIDLDFNDDCSGTFTRRRTENGQTTETSGRFGPA
jgi:hypothetical protein